jgi:tetratricopeptide (TPR) repeat protein
MKRLAIILILFSFAYSQNINLYLTLIEKGRYDEVRENIPDLLSRYPNEPGVKYIQALINNDGDASLAQYKKVIENFPDSEFASQSSIKIGEYLFARGLYSQASAQLKKTIFDYPKSDFHQRALDLMINSYIATGEKDSARFSLALISDLYPKLDYKKYNLGVTPSPKKDSRLVRIEKNSVNERIKIVKAKRTKAKSKKKAYMPWVVQVGAFGKYENANRLKKQLQSSGFPTEVHRINSNGNRLHAVRVVRYETKNQADKIGRSLKSKFGLDFRIINSPK